MSSNLSKNKKTVLSTQGYKGTRDFFPDEQRVRSYIYSKIHKLLKSYGYEEYDGPFVEYLELYAAKSSEEIVRDQLYSFKDKGERILAIRPEMTPTLARMVASKQKELSKPIRWYSIPTCMRYERPQRGRLREFDQLNVDIFGGNPLDEDIEIILSAVDTLRCVGANFEDFEVKINHRGIINSFLGKVLLIPEEFISPLLRLLDKKDKMSSDNFLMECKKLDLDQDQIKKIDKFMSSSIEEVIDILGEHAHPAKELKLRLDALIVLTSFESIKFSPEIMRGFDYYTGMVFEVFDKHPDNNRALFGGGRYDNLVGAFGGDELPGVGYGMGDVTITNFMEVHKLIPALRKETDVCVIRFSESDRIDSLKLVQEFRKYNLNVESPITLGKFGKQIQSAEKSGAKAVAFRGNEEMQNNTFSVKWLATGVQDNYSNDESGMKKFADKIQKC